MVRALDGELITGRETVRLRRDGLPIDVRLSISPIRIDGRSVSGAAVVTREMVDQRANGVVPSPSPRARARAGSSGQNH
jgi:hypothetical protein